MLSLKGEIRGAMIKSFGCIWYFKPHIIRNYLFGGIIIFPELRGYFPSVGRMTGRTVCFEINTVRVLGKQIDC
jgi:hypothetical protein